MSLPEIVQSALEDEPVAARVDLGGEDILVVTPTRTLVYRAEGLLSDESVEEFSHDAERVSVSEGRRKSKVTLDYGLDGDRTFALPAGRVDEALHPVLAGVLNAASITDAGETVKETYRFSELTLIITSARVVKHIGTAVWDGDYEEFHYEDVTDLAFEDGSVATSVVVTIDDRQERFKAPNEEARAVREGIESALLAYHDAASLEEFRASVEPGSDAKADPEDVAFGDGPDPLSANPSELSEDPANSTRAPEDAESADEDDGRAVAASAGVAPDSGDAASAVAAGASDDGDAAADDGFGDSGFRSAEGVAEATGDDVSAELRELRAAIEEQNEQLRRQSELFEQLVQELRQGR